MTPTYRTTELEIAAFLKARGHRLLGAHPQGRVVEFEFAGTAEPDVERYITGETVSARELFEAHRSLRALIQQIREHNTYINGKNRKWIEPSEISIKRA